MKLKFIFLSIFIFAFAVLTPLTHIQAVELNNGGSYEYSTTYTQQELLENIIAPSLFANILQNGGSVSFADITYAQVIEWLADQVYDEFYDTFYQMTHGGYHSQSGLTAWSPVYTDVFTQLYDYLSDKNAFLEDQESDIPVVPSEYESLIDRINGSGFWWKYYENNLYSYDGQSAYALNIYPPSLSSWFTQTNNAMPDTAPTGRYPYIGGVYAQPIQDLYITSLSGTYYFNKTITALKSNSSWNSPRRSPSWFGTKAVMGSIYTLGFKEDYTNLGQFVGLNNTDADNEICSYSTSGTLSNVLYYIGTFFRNVNIYVDNKPFSIVGERNQIINITPTTYIEDTNTPIYYQLPDQTQFDFVKMKNYIISAINNSSVLKYEDIEDCFVDINGVTAIYTVDVLRNDFDDMFEELYSPIYYPKFSVDTQIQPDIQNGVTIINNAVGIIPDDILKVLVYGCSITLFAFLIKKLIE